MNQVSAVIVEVIVILHIQLLQGYASRLLLYSADSVMIYDHKGNHHENCTVCRREPLSFSCAFSFDIVKNAFSILAGNERFSTSQNALAHLF